MNKKQRAVIWIGIVLIAGIGFEEFDSTRVDVARVLLAWAMVGIVGAGLFILLKGDSKTKADKGGKSILTNRVPSYKTIEELKWANKLSADKKILFEEDLTKLVPNWRVVQSNEAFLGWLYEKEPLLKVSYSSILKNAFNKMDAEQASKIFKLWDSRMVETGSFKNYRMFK